MKSSRKLFGASPLKSAAPRISRVRFEEAKATTLASFDYRTTMPRLASGKRFKGFRFFLESRPDHNPPFVSSTFIAAL